MAWKRIDELAHVHPSVYAYLVANKWEVNREVWINERSRADFVAKSPDGIVHTIECKVLGRNVDPSEIADVIVQAKRYAESVFAYPVLAIPDLDYTEAERRKLTSRMKSTGVKLWIVPFTAEIRAMLYYDDNVSVARDDYKQVEEEMFIPIKWDANGRMNPECKTAVKDALFNDKNSARAKQALNDLKQALVAISEQVAD